MKMTSRKSDLAKYRVQSFSPYAVEQCGGQVQFITGYGSELEAGSIKEAKRLARYLLSEDYRMSGEMSEREAYVQVLDANDECVHDEFRTGFRTVTENIEQS